MSSSPSAADVGDRHRRLTALAFLFVGVVYATGGMGYLLGPDAGGWLRLVEIAAAVLTILCLSPMIVWKLRNRDRSLWQAYSGEGGVGMELLNRAKTASWVATFLVLVGLEQFAEDRPDVPSELFLEAALAALVLTFAVAFLILDRDPGEPGPGETPGA